MENKKKKYEKPIAVIVDFKPEDIILTSTSDRRLFDDDGTDNGEKW